MKAVSNYLGRIQSRHFANLQRKANKLDHVSSDQLSEFLSEQLGTTIPTTSNRTDDEGDVVASNDVNHNDDTSDHEHADPNNGSNVDGKNDDYNDEDDESYVEPDYELIQRDLDRAYRTLENLESKRDFIKTRLHTYQSKLKAVEEQHNQTLKSNVQQSEKESQEKDADATSTTVQKIEKYKQALKPVEEIYQKIEFDVDQLERKIRSMHERQQELKLKTEECEVVLHELMWGNHATAIEQMTATNVDSTHRPSDTSSVGHGGDGGDDTSDTIDGTSTENYGTSNSQQSDIDEEIGDTAGAIHEAETTGRHLVSEVEMTTAKTSSSSSNETETHTQSISIPTGESDHHPSDDDSEKKEKDGVDRVI